jgi:hypothetical protein
VIGIINLIHNNTHLKKLDAELAKHAGDPRDVTALKAQISVLDQMISLADGELLKKCQDRRAQLAGRVERLSR